MKVLVIDDDRIVVTAIIEILYAIPEVTEVTGCTRVIKKPSCNEISRIPVFGMPKIEEVIQKIEVHDLILLDHILGPIYKFGTIEEAKFHGANLLPHCVGKQVISISSMEPETDIFFRKKKGLVSGDDATIRSFIKLIRDVHSRTVDATLTAQ